MRFVYDAGGELVAEYGGSPSPAVGATYLSGDHLGTTRLVTDSSGAVLKRYDYAPFGEEIPREQMGRPAGTEFPLGQYPVLASQADGVSTKFTGKERDAETGLDYFETRYLSGAQGRFTSPDGFNILTDAKDADQLKEFLSDPQTWNKYAYVTNNPLLYIDPNGEARWATNPDGSQTWVGDSHGEEQCLGQNNTNCTYWNANTNQWVQITSLFYDGRYLRVFDSEGNLFDMFPATSGRDAELNTDQRERDKGPIPNGRYLFDPSEWSEGGLLRSLLGDWGKWRVPLHPAPGTNTHGRDGFFIHGGRRPGSAGCIDVGPCDERLQKVTKRNPRAIPVDVRYRPPRQGR